MLTQKGKPRGLREGGLRLDCESRCLVAGFMLEGSSSGQGGKRGRAGLRGRPRERGTKGRGGPGLVEEAQVRLDLVGLGFGKARLGGEFRPAVDGGADFGDHALGAADAEAIGVG